MNPMNNQLTKIAQISKDSKCTSEKLTKSNLRILRSTMAKLYLKAMHMKLLCRSMIDVTNGEISIVNAIDSFG